MRNERKKKKKRKASDDLPRHASLCTPRQSQADSVAARRSIADTSDISDCEVAPTPYRLGSPWTSAASPVLRDLCGARTWERISVSHPHYGHPYPCRHWDEQSASHRGRIQTKRRLSLEPPGRNDRVHCLFLPASSLAFAGGEQSTNAGSSKCALAEAHSAALLEGSPNLDCATAVEGTNDEYSLTTLCRASQRVSRFIEDVQGSKKLFEQLQRHGHYVKQFECEFAVEAASPEIFYRVLECLELCPNLTTLQTVYKDRTISPGRMQSPEPLFKYLSQRHAARLENFTFSTSLAASGLALPAFLDDFLAQCSSLTTLHLALEGLKAVPSALDLIAARIRRLPRLQDLWVLSTDFIRPTGALVSPSPIRHIHIADSVSIEGLECIQREYGATLEHLQVGGIRLPDCGEPALLFPALCSLQIKYYLRRATPLSHCGSIRRRRSKYSTSDRWARIRFQAYKSLSASNPCQHSSVWFYKSQKFTLAGGTGPAKRTGRLWTATRKTFSTASGGAGFGPSLSVLKSCKTGTIGK
mgnify:FL=1